ncbi:MAG: hypothetical protein HOQ04_00225 [Pseudarthrobacter sp.]|nr:hypothetical protein [Pseudarthrobacter sp.]NUS34892.1 hypothetical protein [Pseudarthrobacter sp.]
MMQGLTFPGNLFFDPLATNLGNALAPAAGAQEPDSGHPPGPATKRGVQTAAEHKALRAASLSKVSKDLERMLRERRR